MNIKVIVKVPTQADPRQVREHLLRHYRIDATHLLELALDFWELLDTDDEEALMAALEYALPLRFRRLARALYDDNRLTPGEFSELLYRTGNLLIQLYQSLQPILHPLVEGRWNRPAEYRLARHVGMDAAAVIEVRPTLPKVKFEVAPRPAPHFPADDEIEFVY